ncbi:O-methyltransferase-domain-containing protein [Collybia nuda]|uniref:O-methyltransferase-domain-containing protein n=1 Tax=Collybia nuda TaxID=64659 RepID=A0A9P6CF95_9AGAR|nr:O-methyltransferase-domain-containing protein [Collybia nuda]
MNTREQVDALLSLIKDSAYKALDEYEKHGQEAPTLDSLVTHPLDVEVNTVDLKRIIRTLEGACDQLCSTLAPPAHTVVNRGQELYWSCLGVAVRSRIADALADHPRGLSAQELSDITKVDAVKLTSILRLLATRHCFKEIDTGVFANNRLSLMLHSNEPVSSFIDLLKEPSQAAASLRACLEDPEYGPSKSLYKSPFMYSIKDQGLYTSLYDSITRNPERRKVLGTGMIGMNFVMGTLSVIPIYPWKEYATVCDVGSGIGAFSQSLVKSFPSMRVTLHDTPETINLSKDIWAKSNPDAVVSGHISFAPGNFLEEIPVKNQDIYYLRNIIHNWPDKEALSILKNIRNAMGPHSRVLIHDYVMRPLNRCEPNDLDTAPEPLLPNYGGGQVRLYNQDVSMLLLYNSKERTVSEVSSLGREASSKLEKFWDLGDTSVLEYVAS